MVTVPQSNAEGVASAVEQFAHLKDFSNWRWDYDPATDTIYIRIGENRPAISYFLPSEPELLFRLDMSSGQLVGIDLTAFRTHFRRKHPKLAAAFFPNVISRSLAWLFYREPPVQQLVHFVENADKSPCYA